MHSYGLALRRRIMLFVGLKACGLISHNIFKFILSQLCAVQVLSFLTVAMSAAVCKLCNYGSSTLSVTNEQV